MAKTEGTLKMGRLQFMNQDGEWESFPTEDEIYRAKEVVEILDTFTFTTRCCLCNETIPYKDIKVNLMNKSWSCSKCHAVNGLTKP
jgi:fructose-1,6-bisphosphatase